MPRAAADTYAESCFELDSAWQDESAGKPWALIAKELNKAADRIDKALAKAGY